MTNHEEVNRVRRIHAQLDAHAECQLEIDQKTPDSVIAEAGWTVFEGKTLRYTVQEIRAWPATKAALIAKLLPLTHAPEAFAYVHAESGVLCACEYESWTAGPVSRGLCMYRELMPGVATMPPCWACGAPSCDSASGHKTTPEGTYRCLRCWGRSIHENTRVRDARLRDSAADKPGAALAKPPEAAPVTFADPYAQHQHDLVGRLISDARFEAGKPLDALTAASMDKEDNAPDLWKGETTTPRERLVAGLAAEMRVPMAKRKAALAAKFGPRKGIDDSGGFSSSSYED